MPFPKGFFSFNTINGKCPVCEGRGYTWVASIEKIIANPKKPIKSIFHFWLFKAAMDSILVEYEEQIELIKPKAEKVLGLDYSSKELYVDSKTNSPDYPKFYRQAEEKLKKAQRILSRRGKGGENRKKQRLKVARLHEKVANQRKDFLHKLSKQIANAYDAVAIEDLNMRGMAQGLHLAKSTNDNGFGMFKTFLAYKLAEQGKPLVVIDKWYPFSKTCHVCGEKNKELTISDREWICKKCNTVHNRDINAAINIKNEGCRILGIT